MAKLLQGTELKTLLTAAGGRPADAWRWIETGQASVIAQSWQALPQAMARGDASALADWGPTQSLDALLKLCHDVSAVRAGAAPRFFDRQDLGGLAAAHGKAALYAMSSWSRELMAATRTVEHPFNPGLLLESLASRAELALNAR